MFASGAGATWRLLVPNLTRARVSSGTSDFRSRSTNYKKVPTPQLLQGWLGPLCRTVSIQDNGVYPPLKVLK